MALKQLRKPAMVRRDPRSSLVTWLTVKRRIECEVVRGATRERLEEHSERGRPWVLASGDVRTIEQLWGLLSFGIVRPA